MRNHSTHLKIILGVVAGVLVLAAFGVPVLSNLPLLALLAICPLAMMFMMRGMGHGRTSDEKTTDTDRGAHRH